eukprot:gb/GFBE01054290.1/.p1 GENE.gb/GFBE01054290.1/~~gb/GFBE01054290.1/.p1  ORF type:complete len:351 (+),score=65.74 gb/GFBE01054290.1/:1-1053(+)
MAALLYFSAALVHVALGSDALCEEATAPTAAGKALLQLQLSGARAQTRFVPTQGTGGTMLATSDAAACDSIAYHRSALEQTFAEHSLEYTDNLSALCDALGSSASEWLGANLAGGSAPSDEVVFSRMCNPGLAPQVIEPLAGILRDPRVFCEETQDPSPQRLLYSIDWLVLADSRSYATAPGAKRILFDAGGSKFIDAMSFFTSKYEERGLPMDEIYVWEAEEQAPDAYWEGVSAETRERWEPHVTFYNGVPVTAEIGAEHNPVERIHQLCSPEDFCAFKLDIDTPEVELPIVEQLLQDPGNLKEFFFEHHVSGLMKTMGPWHDVNGTYADSYRMFGELRQKGVRAHSWI